MGIFDILAAGSPEYRTETSSRDHTILAVRQPPVESLDVECLAQGRRLDGDAAKCCDSGFQPIGHQHPKVDQE